MVITEKQVKALSLHSDELHAHRIANPNAVVEFQTANPEKPISAIGPFWLKNQDNEILPIYVDETVEMENSGREASSSEFEFYEQLIVEEAHRMRHCELQSLGYLPFTETPLASPRDTSRFLRNPQTPEGSPPASQQLSSSNSSLMVIDEELDYVDKHFERLLSQERNTEQVQRETSAAVEMMETEHSPMSEQISAAIAMPDDSIIDLNIEAEKVATATTTSHSLTSFVTSNSLGPILQQTSSIVNALGANTTTSRSVILNLGVSTLRPTMVTYSSSISLTPISSLPHVTASTESIPLIPTESNEQTDETIEVVDQQDTSDDIEVLDEISFKHTETSVLSPNVATSFSSVEVKPELLLEPIAKSLALHTDSVFYNHAMSSHEFDLIPFAQFATNKSRQLLFVVVKPDEGAMGESTDSWIKPPILQSTYQIFQGPVRSARNTPLQLYILGKTTSDDITKAVTALILSVSWYDQPLKVTEVFELLIGPMNRKFQWKTLVFTSVSERMLLSKSTVAENLVICKLPPGTTSSTQ
ncbi:hypothetical protein M3Y95_00322700 [Aphelenchoides besseyi]|nr:hypothetical protein M3Y95_00322700 [Aphelenchoides besseyi]